MERPPVAPVTDVVDRLLQLGADPGAGNWMGSTPLHLVHGLDEGPELVTALVNAGADVNARTGGSQTPLHEAARSADDPAVIAALLSAGAEVSPADGQGETPLHHAVAAKKPAHVALLVEAGGGCECTERDGQHAPARRHGLASPNSRHRETRSRTRTR